MGNTTHFLLIYFTYILLPDCLYENYLNFHFVKHTYIPVLEFLRGLRPQRPRDMWQFGGNPTQQASFNCDVGFQEKRPKVGGRELGTKRMEFIWRKGEQGWRRHKGPCESWILHLVWGLSLHSTAPTSIQGPSTASQPPDPLRLFTSL